MCKRSAATLGFRRSRAQRRIETSPRMIATNDARLEVRASVLSAGRGDSCGSRRRLSRRVAPGMGRHMSRPTDNTMSIDIVCCLNARAHRMQFWRGPESTPFATPPMRIVGNRKCLICGGRRIGDCGQALASTAFGQAADGALCCSLGQTRQRTDTRPRMPF